MSRIQKKKSANEKFQKKPIQDSRKEGSAAEKSSVSKSAGFAKALKPGADKAAAETGTGGQGKIQQAIEFLREVKVELKKVTWPTQKQVTGTTIVVIVFVFIVAGFLGLFDLGLSTLVQAVLT